MPNRDQIIDSFTVQQLDSVFLDIVTQLNATLVEGTSKSVHRIIDLSMNFLSEKGQGALQQFYGLYFSSQSVEGQKSDVNHEVDDLFDAIQNEMAQADYAEGKELNLSHIVENEEKRNSRLAIAAVQKQLETLITLETSLREKLVPAMMSMQFEDLVRQRIQRIDAMWKAVFMALGNNSEGSLMSLKESGKDTFAGTQDERNLYFPIVLGIPAEDSEVSKASEETWFKAS